MTEDTGDMPLQETLIESETAEILYEETQKRDAYTKVYKKTTAVIPSFPTTPTASGRKSGSIRRAERWNMMWIMSGRMGF